MGGRKVIRVEGQARAKKCWVLGYGWGGFQELGNRPRSGQHQLVNLTGSSRSHEWTYSGHQDGLVNQHPHEEHEGWSGHDGATDNEGKSNGRRDDEYVQVKVSEVWVLLPLYDLCDGISSLFCATLSLKSKGQKGSQLTGYAG